MKQLLFFLTCYLLTLLLQAQDKIILRNGAVYRVKISAVTDSAVFFIDKDGEKFSVDKSWIDQMKYENIKNITFANLNDTIFNKVNSAFFYNEPKIRKHIDSLGAFYQIKNKTFQDYYLKGESDAYLRRNYDGIYRAAFLSTLVLPPFGLLVSYSMLMTPPQVNPIYVTDANLLKEEAYLYGYKKISYKQKSLRVWKGFTLGLITGSAIYYLILK
jgi:hypothetical protein